MTRRRGYTGADGCELDPGDFVYTDRGYARIVRVLTATEVDRRFEVVYADGYRAATRIAHTGSVAAYLSR
jgi:hypothetical protein